LLVRWFEAEWEPYYGEDGPGDAGADLRASMNQDTLPLCLVALDGDEPLGTISLKTESISHPELSPWGAAFLVAPHLRGRGIGTQLVAALEHEARRLGHRRLYMSTDAANGIVEVRGWQAIDTADSLRGKVTVYELVL
jgi:GNAT superfamily N-acetyltransferase